MAAVGVKGLIENFSEGIAPDPIGSYWGPQTSTLDRCPGASQLLVPMPGSGPSVSVSARDAFGPPVVQEDECWSELFQTMPVGGKFWSRFA